MDFQVTEKIKEKSPFSLTHETRALENGKISERLIHLSSFGLILFVFLDNILIFPFP